MLGLIFHYLPFTLNFQLKLAIQCQSLVETDIDFVLTCSKMAVTWVPECLSVGAGTGWSITQTDQTPYLNSDPPSSSPAPAPPSQSPANLQQSRNLAVRKLPKTMTLGPGTENISHPLLTNGFQRQLVIFVTYDNEHILRQDLIWAFLKCFFVTILDFMTRIVQSQSPCALEGKWDKNIWTSLL